ncbi:MAG: hypothetical protein ACYDBQ_00055 [Thermoplasmatota archaeon]
MPAAQLWGVVAGCIVAAAGIAWGAELQREAFLAPLPGQNLDTGAVAAGSAILLTGLLTAAGGALVLGLLVPRPRRKAVAPLLLGAIGLYGVVNLLQTGFPNYYVCDHAGDATNVACHQAVLRVQLLLHNEPSVPSLLAPVWAFLLAGLLAVWAALHPLVAGRGSRTPQWALKRQVSASAVAVPFAAVAGWGVLKVLLAIPAGTAGATPYLGVLPLLGLTLFSMAVLQALKVRTLGRLVGRPASRLAAEEAWTLWTKLEWVAFGALAALALVASFLPNLAMPLVTLPLTYQTTMKGHAALLVLVTVALIPSLRHAQAVARMLRQPLDPARGDPSPAALGMAAMLAAFVGAGLATFLLDGPLWAWLAAFGAMALTVPLQASSRSGAAALLLAGAAAWAAGNSTFAQYTGKTDNLLIFDASPGSQALWRLLGAAVAGAGLACMAPGLGSRRGAPARAMGLGACLAAAAFLELPVGAWVEVATDGSYHLAVGSLLASQDPPVRVVAHVAACALTVAAGWFLARIVRPEWFAAPKHSRP